ncbi:hypothetical protein RJ45_16900 [Photobacterium gaetbulicola]|uniref:Outer membrane protein beta-barrel domain-containing protein n=1 Tax=Photobacterium gaetbulicola TaxID=1295392 RepID=A0A0B9G195_9GAMM|nr:outer membrane beta-barrel protein [Photobacterium gaetbulicola]KHT62498.1 hypothetical protein RJ45_16900 [Photobacterium gaetbulicola]
MNKLSFAALTALTALIALSGQLNAAELQHRLGVGYSSTDFEALGVSFGYGNGIKLEYGYDFNQIAGMHVSYEQNKDGILKGDTLKLGGDIGYTFEFDEASIKPFISGGFYSYEENFYDDSGLYWGLGARATYKNFYIDLRQDFFEMKDQGISVDMEQFAVTLGIRL